MGGPDDAGEAFVAWQEIIKRNKNLQSKELSPYAPLVEFYYGKRTLKNLD